MQILHVFIIDFVTFQQKWLNLQIFSESCVYQIEMLF